MNYSPSKSNKTSVTKQDFITHSLGDQEPFKAKSNGAEEMRYTSSDLKKGN